MCFEVPWENISGKSKVSEHYVSELTELPQANIGDIDNIVALADRCLWVCAVLDIRAQRQDETAHVLIQREQTHHLRRLLGCRKRALTLLGSGVCSDSLHVNLRDLEQIHRNAALVPTTKPLWVESPGGFILFHIDGVVEGVKLVLLAPVLGVFQLVVSFLGKKLASSQVAEEGFVVMAGGC